ILPTHSQAHQDSPEENRPNPDLPSQGQPRQASGDQDLEVLPADWDCIFQRADDDVIRIKVNLGTTCRPTDALLLLIYAHQKLHPGDFASALLLTEGLRRSGVEVQRLDRLLAGRERMVARMGTKKPTDYRLTHAGYAYAARLFAELVKKQTEQGK